MNAPEPLPRRFNEDFDDAARQDLCDLGAHRYRVTIEHLHSPHAGELLDAPLVFETTHQDSLVLLFIAERLRATAAQPRRPCLTRPI